MCSCSFSSEGSNCNGGGFGYVNAYDNSDVDATVSAGVGCSVGGNGRSSCYE